MLVDFWTYSCINCIRSIPHVEAWYKEYSNDGLVMVGVSTRSSSSSTSTATCRMRRQFDMTYPVAVDNNYSTWDAYNNEYWPADYLIDPRERYVSTTSARVVTPQWRPIFGCLLTANGVITCRRGPMSPTRRRPATPSPLRAT